MEITNRKGKVNTMENCCKTCVHFITHYVLTNEKYIPIDLGHCVFPRIKPRDATTKACAHFHARQEAEENDT